MTAADDAERYVRDGTPPFVGVYDRIREHGRPIYLAKNVFDLGTFDLVVDQLGPDP